MHMAQLVTALMEEEYQFRQLVRTRDQIEATR